MIHQNVVIFGNAGWYSDSCGNSSQQLALAYLQLGYRVLYLAPNRTPPTSLPQYSGRFCSLSISADLLKRVKKILKDWQGNASNTVFICSMATNAAEGLLKFFSHEHFEIIYRHVDLFSAAEKDHDYSTGTAELACRVARVIAVSHPNLIDSLPLRTKRIVTISNGVDFELFGSSLRDWKQPADLVRGEITIGFWGTFWGNRLDWPLVKILADLNPKWEFHFIGDLQFLTPHPLSLPSNVRFLDFKKKEQLPAYLKHFDLCLIPYREDLPFAKYSNPIKALESLAALKPVVTIHNRSLENYPAVHFYSSPVEAMDEIRSASVDKSDTEAILRFVRENTWQKKAEALLRELHESPEGGFNEDII